MISNHPLRIPQRLGNLLETLSLPNMTSHPLEETTADAPPFPRSKSLPTVTLKLLQVRPGGGLRIVRSLGVARLVTRIIGTGLPIGVACSICV